MCFLFCHGLSELVHEQRDEHDDHHVWQSVAEHKIGVHQQPIQDKACQPDEQVVQTESGVAAVMTQKQDIRDLDGDHRREYGTDQIKEVGDVIHRKKDGCQDADEGDHDANSLLFP